MEIVIPETAVAEVGGIRVAVGNIWEEEFELDSKQVTASRATLYVMGDTPDTDFDVRVHGSYGANRRRNGCCVAYS